MNKKQFWVTAEVIREKFGFTKDQMFKMRQDNPAWWKFNDNGKRSYLYDLNLISESLLKTVEA